MKSVVLHGAHDVRLEHRAKPETPLAGQVMLRVTRAGLCGTDVAEFRSGPILTPLRNRHPFTGVQGPITLGHEFIGVVEQTASSRFEVGARVAAGAGVWCGQCAWCRRGQTNLCSSYWTFGLSADGALTQYIVVPDQMLHTIPDSVDDDNAALAQPLAVGLHAVERSGARAHDTVVVLGAGAIGSFVIAGLNALGPARVLAVDVVAERLETARRLGAEVTVNAAVADPLGVLRDEVGPDLADVVIEASGAPDGLLRAVRLTRRGGTILLVGMPKSSTSLNTSELILGEIDVRTSVAHVCDRNLPRALELLRHHDLADLLVEAVVPIDRVVSDALERLAAGSAKGKYLVDTQAGL